METFLGVATAAAAVAAAVSAATAVTIRGKS